MWLKVAKSGEVAKWEKVGKSGKKWLKVANSWGKVGKVAKIGEKW